MRFVVNSFVDLHRAMLVNCVCEFTAVDEFVCLSIQSQQFYVYVLLALNLQSSKFISVVNSADAINKHGSM
jgi:hypothetical protein